MTSLSAAFAAHIFFDFVFGYKKAIVHRLPQEKIPPRNGGYRYEIVVGARAM